MKPFAYKRAADTADAVKLGSAASTSYIAGGTNLVDLMKEGIAEPSTVVDIARLSLTEIKQAANGTVLIGALARNTDTANHPLIRANYPLLTQAILAGASPQIRNMATNGGNLLQRTRCLYFYDVATACNKRSPGSGCDAKGGLNKYSAVLGWSDSCVAVHPSDMCVALAALEAVVKVRGADGRERSIKLDALYRSPDKPEVDTTLAAGDLIVAIELPKPRFASNYAYIKLRDRASYAFALASAAAALELRGGNIVEARLALGGVAHKPWRAAEAENFLKGKKAEAANFAQAAEIALKDAKPLSENGYKIDLAKMAIKRALTDATARGGAK